MNVVGVIALTVAAACGGCLVLMIAAATAAASRGNGRAAMRAGAVAAVFAALSLIAFVVLGAGAAGYIAGV